MSNEPINPIWDPITDGQVDLKRALKSKDSSEELRQVGICLALSGYGVASARAWLSAAIPRDRTRQYAVSQAWDKLDFADGQWWH